MNNKFTEMLFGGILVGLLKVLIVVCAILFVVGLVFIGNIFSGGEILPYVSLCCLSAGFFGYIYFTIAYLIVKAAHLYIKKNEE